MSGQILGFEATVGAGLPHLQVHVHDVLGKVGTTGEGFLALCTLVLLLQVTMSLPDVLL